MKSARRSGRIAGSRVHQHTMALKFETGWKGGERRASVEGRPPLRKRAVTALCSLQGLYHFPSHGHFVSCVFSRHKGSWTAGTQAAPPTWLAFV